MRDYLGSNNCLPASDRSYLLRLKRVADSQDANGPDLVSQLHGRLDDSSLSCDTAGGAVMFFGNMGVGKSTAVNMLLGKDMVAHEVDGFSCVAVAPGQDEASQTVPGVSDTVKKISVASVVQAKAAAEAAAAILKDNSKAADIFISGVKGRHSVVNGLYSPTQEKGQDGRTIYRKSGEFGVEALCIEHFEGRWWVENQSDRGSVAWFAVVEGGCALEDCRSRIWKISDGRDFVDQPSVQMVIGEEAKSQASGAA
jgi:hypothetical protein